MTQQFGHDKYVYLIGYKWRAAKRGTRIMTYYVRGAPGKPCVGVTGGAGLMGWLRKVGWWGGGGGGGRKGGRGEGKFSDGEMVEAEIEVEWKD